MINAYKILGRLLYSCDKQNLVDSLPDLRSAIEELVASIKNSPTYESAEESIKLLHVVTSPLNALQYKYKVELENIPRDIFRFENIYDDETRRNMYSALKEGKILNDV